MTRVANAAGKSTRILDENSFRQSRVIVNNIVDNSNER